MKHVETRFEISDSNLTSGDGVKVRMVMTNVSDKDLRVLTWQTPLEGLLSDCLDVRVNGKPVAYDGPLLKRGAPGEQSFVPLGAGKSLEKDFVVSDAYDTTQPGEYTIRLKGDLQVTDPQAPATRGELRKTAAALRVVEPLSAQTTVRIMAGPVRRQTLGASVRANQALAKSSLRATAGIALAAGIKAPQTTGGSATQKKSAEKAHQAGYDLCVNALKTLANDARYKEWFGAHTATRYAKVKDTYGKVKARMEAEVFTYDLTGTGCGPNVFAYTYHGSTTIWLCDAFWQAPDLGTDSKAGTVLHEHTHSDAKTDDKTYGQAKCRQLAINAPDDAVVNADSYEYHAGG